MKDWFIAVLPSKIECIDFFRSFKEFIGAVIFPILFIALLSLVAAFSLLSFTESDCEKAGGIEVRPSQKYIYIDDGEERILYGRGKEVICAMPMK
jgi:hypothetical protein